MTFQLEEVVEAQLLLFDATGKLLRQAYFNGNYHEMNSANLAQGLYFYQLRDKKGQLFGSGKVVKE